MENYIIQIPLNDNIKNTEKLIQKYIQNSPTMVTNHKSGNYISYPLTLTAIELSELNKLLSDVQANIIKGQLNVQFKTIEELNLNRI